MTTTQQDKTEEKWITTTQAIKELGISRPKFYRRLKHYQFKMRKNTFDERSTYVDINEIHRVLGF